MRLKSIDGVAELGVTIAGYESGDYLGDRDTANWLEIDLSVQTAHGRGASRVPCMHTWDAVQLAAWLAAFDPGHALDQGDTREWACPEPNLQFHIISQAAHEVVMQVYFILEQPGEWQMDDAQEGARYYIDTMDLTGGGQIFARLRRHCALNSSISRTRSVMYQSERPVVWGRCKGWVASGSIQCRTGARDARECEFGLSRVAYTSLYGSRLPEGCGAENMRSGAAT